MIWRDRKGATVALPPLRYEALREDQRLVVEKEQEKQDKADRQSHEAQKTEKATPDNDRERFQPQARDQVAWENALKFERQQVDYARRQREETAQKDREARSSEYMKEHHPAIYARNEQDKARRQESIDRSWPGRESNEQKYPLSDRAKALMQKTLDRDAAEREDYDRSER